MRSVQGHRRHSADQRRPWRAAAMTFRALIAFGYPLLALFLRQFVCRCCRRKRSRFLRRIDVKNRKEANCPDFLFRWLSPCNTFEGILSFMARLSVFTTFALKSRDIDRDNICSRYVFTVSDVGQKEISIYEARNDLSSFLLGCMLIRDVRADGSVLVDRTCHLQHRIRIGIPTIIPPRSVVDITRHVIIML